MSEKLLLNKNQIEAVNHLEGPLVVLAGAGSGKTCVVVNRIAALLEKGVPSEDILAVTFTNKAAKELSYRIERKSLFPPLTVTFHALGVLILRESIDFFGYGRDFQIFDVSDSEALLRDVIFSITETKDKKFLKEMKQLISLAKSNLCDPVNIAKLDYNFKTMHQKNMFIEIYEKYVQRMKEVNAVDFDDLIMLTVFLLQNEPYKERYADRWKFILVDEYQDTNHGQYLICRALCAKHQNLFVVGDPDQSIYSWRGAEISNILNFEKDFKGARLISLEQNYRSHGHILSAANKVIEKNNRLYEKKLFSEKGDGEKVEVKIFNNGFDEVNFVIKKIHQYERMGISHKDMVVFYRTNSQSRMFEDGFMEYCIPYQVVGGMSFYQRKEIKDIIAYLRILYSPIDFVSFSRVINLPKRGIGKKTLENILAESKELNSTIIDVLRLGVKGESKYRLTKGAKEGAISFLSFYDGMQELIHAEAALSELIAEVYEQSNYEKVLLANKESLSDRIENIDALISKADDYDKKMIGDLSKFLEDICLDSDMEEEETIEKVSLMTIHNAKGLEFDVCFIAGLEEDVFPHIRSKNSEEELEEERRLFYVGMTRAKQYLHMVCAKRRFLWGNERLLSVSRFIYELPQEHIIGDISSKAYYPSTSNQGPSDIEQSEFYVGGNVIHKSFGKGVINKIYETSYGPTYDILFFGDNQKRTLVAKYAKLKQVN